MRSTWIAIAGFAISASGLAAFGACNGDSPPLSNGLCDVADLECAAHASFFPIGQTSKHALGAPSPDPIAPVISCDGCHKGRESFREALCVSCHQYDPSPLTDVHEYIPGFELIDTACFTCHPSGDIGDVQGVDFHTELWFPIDPGDAHADDNPLFSARVGTRGSGCIACHASVEDRSIPLCVDCHSRDGNGDGTRPLAEVHGGLVPGTWQAIDTECKACHSITPVPVEMQAANHPGAVTQDHHNSGACVSVLAPVRCDHCHNLTRGGTREWAIDFGRATCASCHAATDCSAENPGACGGSAQCQ